MHSSSANLLSSVHTAWTTFVNALCTGTMNSRMPNEWSATQTVTNELSPSTGKNVAQLRTTIAQVGTGVGITISPRSSIVVGLRSTLPTRAGRGRMYWPAPHGTILLPNGNLVAADVVAIAAGFANGLATFQATSTPVIFHRASLTGHTVVNVVIGEVLGNQRRRTNKSSNAYTVDPI